MIIICLNIFEYNIITSKNKICYNIITSKIEQKYIPGGIDNGTDAVYNTGRKVGEIMGQITMTVQVDEQDKAMFEKLCADAGTTVSDVICMFVETIVRAGKIPDDIVEMYKMEVCSANVSEDVRKSEELPSAR